MYQFNGYYHLFLVKNQHSAAFTVSFKEYIYISIDVISIDIYIYNINGLGVCPYQWVCIYHISNHIYFIFTMCIDIYIYRYMLQH